MTSDLVALHPPRIADPLPQGGRLRWVNDWPEDNFQKKIAKGYLIVERDGQQVKQKAGSRPDGSMGYRYLMQGPLMLEHDAPDPFELVTYNDIIEVVGENIVEHIVIPSGFIDKTPKSGI